jgi:hypothetical protein
MVLAMACQATGVAFCPGRAIYFEDHNHASTDAHEHAAHAHADHDEHGADGHHSPSDLADPAHEHDADDPAHVHVYEANSGQTYRCSNVADLTLPPAVLLCEIPWLMADRIDCVRPARRHVDRYWAVGPPIALSTTHILI